jgi:hypothetical protein
MALVPLQVAGWAGVGFVSLVYDDSTLLLTQVSYGNPCPQDATLILAGTINITIPSGSSGTIDLSGYGINMVTSTDNRRDPVVSPPVSVAERYPA